MLYNMIGGTFMEDKQDYINKSKNLIKSCAAKKGHNLSSLNELLNSKKENKTTLQNFTQKINNGTIRFVEILEIAEVLGYKIVWEEV